MGVPTRVAPAQTPARKVGRSSTPSLSMIVPVVRRANDLTAILDAFAGAVSPVTTHYEFVFVFDGGFGAPPKELVARSRRDRRVRILQFAHTFGETAALQAGIAASQGSVLLTVPPYFQVHPQGVRQLLEAVRDGADVAVARRSPRRDGWLNRLQARVFHALVHGVSAGRFHDLGCGVRAMRREVAESLRLYGDLHRFIPALALREGYTVTEIPLPQHPADARARVYGPGVYVRRLLDLMTFFFLAKFTEKPLRFFGLLGSTFFATGGVITLVLLAQRLGGTPIANRPMLLLGVLLLALGVQFVGLGLVGEIIVYLRAPYRRSYRIRETL
jgi:glycosyltransferase involved in cell wall biosynthesis